MDIGLGHESNGRDGPASRSLNIAFLRPTFTFGDQDTFTCSANQWYLRPTIYAYLDDEENPDIGNYRGHVDLELGYIRCVTLGHDTTPEPWRLWTTLRKGNRSDYGSIEANLALALASFSGDRLNGWLMLQYFTGHGESLLGYNRRDTQFRAGLAVMF